MTLPTLTEQLAALPARPGIYIFKNAQGTVLYVGKAKVLKNRVKSYFARPLPSTPQSSKSGVGPPKPSKALDPAKQSMVKKITSLETISTDTENEALVLEANLIRKHQPPYNVILRDDKYYLFIKITKEPVPRIFPVRRITKDGARYFGPYSSAASVRATLRLLQRIFPFRGEKDSPADHLFPHPLFSSSTNYSLPTTHYSLMVKNIIRFLKGDRDTIMRVLAAGMKRAAQNQQFEQAALFRNQLHAIQRLEGSQKVYLPSKESFDTISLKSEANQSAVNVFQIRQGKLLGKQTFLLRHHSQTSPADIIRQFLLQYYQVAQDIPGQILLPLHLPDKEALSSYIRPAEPPILATPKRGKKRQLILMGETNAAQFLSLQKAAFESALQQRQAHQALVAAIGLDPARTHRLETYDISNIQGNLATASMVVFQDGAPMPAHYRKFKIKFTAGPNDFAMLQETLRRRFAERNQEWPAPDLVIVDGGKGQLSAAKKILDFHHLTIPLIALAKREEEIFIYGRPQPLRLPFDSPALFLIQRMRDEAHRFTITYHRLLRSKASQRSILDEIPGIGPKSKQALLQTFGSVQGIRLASDEDLIKTIGTKKTRLIRQYV